MDGRENATLLNQIQAARFAMHAVRKKVYADAVRRGEMTESEAAEMYRSAMENFDGLMESAKTGVYAAAIDREMRA